MRISELSSDVCSSGLIIRRSRGCRSFVGIPVRRLDLVLFVKLDLILAAEQAAARRRWQAEDVVPLVDGKQALGEVWIAELPTHLILAGDRLDQSDIGRIDHDAFFKVPGDRKSAV